MCGIVGYIGENAAKDILLQGLKNLEYRGYDSAGVALNDNETTSVYKAQGKLDNLCSLLNRVQLKPSARGIGHISWATHGAATETNAHPHKSNDGKLVLVHNGIIENFRELRQELEKQGFRFYSQTDTETAVHLIDREYKKCGNLEQAVINAVALLKGAFAFCIMHDDEPDKIIAVRKNAPLLVGLGNNENMIASDVPALIGKVNRIIYLEDNEIAIVHRCFVEVKNFAGDVVEKKIENLAFEPELISKRGYAHFMLKEINEQPSIIRRQLAEYFTDNGEIKLRNINLMALMQAVDKIEIVACGSSLHAAMTAKYMIEELAHIPVMVESASEYIYKYNLTDDKTLVIGISQSGETADTITALKQAKQKNAKILVLTNREDSSIVRYADFVLPLKAGIEVSVAATKSYTAQLMLLYLLALKLAQMRLGMNDKLRKLKEELFEVPAKIEQVLCQTNLIKTCAEKYAKAQDYIFIGRGISYPSVMEGALKLKEISYINANAYTAGELKHGPIALVDEKMPVVAVLTKDNLLYDKMISNCQEVKARKGKIIAVTNDAAHQDMFDDIILLPESSSELMPLLIAPALQLLAYYTALSLGREVDQPRNLAKSVTVE